MVYANFTIEIHQGFFKNVPNPLYVKNKLKIFFSLNENLWGKINLLYISFICFVLQCKLFIIKI